MFQIGYLCRSLISYLNEIPVRDQTTYDLIVGFIRWNLNYARYGYYNQLTNVNTVSNGTAMTFCDVAVRELLFNDSENVAFNGTALKPRWLAAVRIASKSSPVVISLPKAAI